MKLDDFTAQAFHVYFQLYRMFLSSFVSSLFDHMEIVYSRFGLGSSGFRLSAHPFQFFEVKLLGFVCFGFKLCLSRFFIL